MTKNSPGHILALVARVLLIDDDPIQSDVYLRRLLIEGYSSTWAKDGKEGLKMALENHPSLILLDVRMPKMDGLAVIEQLRKDDWGKTVPVIMITNHDPDSKTMESISNNNPSYFLLKPTVELEELIEKINDALANPAPESPPPTPA